MNQKLVEEIVKNLPDELRNEIEQEMQVNLDQIKKDKIISGLKKLTKYLDHFDVDNDVDGMILCMLMVTLQESHEAMIECFRNRVNNGETGISGNDLGRLLTESLRNKFSEMMHECDNKEFGK